MFIIIFQTPEKPPKRLRGILHRKHTQEEVPDQKKPRKHRAVTRIQVVVRQNGNHPHEKSQEAQNQQERNVVGVDEFEQSPKKTTRAIGQVAIKVGICVEVKPDAKKAHDPEKKDTPQQDRQWQVVAQQGLFPHFLHDAEKSSLFATALL